MAEGREREVDTHQAGPDSPADGCPRREMGANMYVALPGSDVGDDDRSLLRTYTHSATLKQCYGHRLNNA